MTHPNPETGKPEPAEHKEEKKEEKKK